MENFSVNNYFSQAFQHSQVINELRLRSPISERNYSITDIVSDAKPMSQEENRDVKQALKIAQTTVDSLKVRTGIVFLKNSYTE